MRSPSRRGFTLVELLIAIVIFGIVSTAIYGLLVRTQRLSRTQAERSIMQANVRTGLALITSELRELNARGSAADIASPLTATGITYRGMRGLGFVCDLAAGYVTVSDATLGGYRPPTAARDSLLIFVDNDVSIATDDGWTRRDITAVAPENCADGSAGTRLSFTDAIPSSPDDTLAMIVLGSPVRTFEFMRISSMSVGPETWLGAASLSGGETLQPILGPLAAGGVNFTYWAGVAGGTATNAPSDVRTIRLQLVGITENIVAAGAGTVAWQRASDTLTTDIRLRNAP